MNEGVYLKLDYDGWSVMIVNEWGTEQRLAGSFETMEEAARAAVASTGRPHYAPFKPF